LSDLALFLGRLHPVLVHLPIGVLVAAGVLQAWVSWRQRRGRASTAEAAIGPLLGLAALGAVVAATAGWLLGANGGYAGDLFARHRLLGFGLAGSALVTAGLWRLASRRSDRSTRLLYGTALVSTLALLVAAGHAGAVLTRGEGYFIEHAPPPLRALIEVFAPEPAFSDIDTPPEQAVVYSALVQPVLESRCVACHGAERSEGGLRLDGPEGIGAGGEHGPAVVPGRPESSELWRRISLPPWHADAMPPPGRRRTTASEGAVLHWWIAEGAPFEKVLAEVEVAPDVRDTIEAHLGPLPPDGPPLPPVKVEHPDPGALAAARTAGFTVKPIADGLSFVLVHAANTDALGDAELKKLLPLAPQVVWMDLRGTEVTDAGLATVGRFPHLVRLDLSGTSVSDTGLAHLGELPHLESLNLYGTAVGDGGLAHLESLESLRRLYLWQTDATLAAVDRLRAALPELEVEMGGGPA
jgi:uncharacterized membrane protein